MKKFTLKFWVIAIIIMLIGFLPDIVHGNIEITKIVQVSIAFILLYLLLFLGIKFKII